MHHPTTRKRGRVEVWARESNPREALPPDTLQKIVRQAIEGVIDRAAFEAEVAAERKDATFLVGVRRTVRKALSDIDLDMEGGDDE